MHIDNISVFNTFRAQPIPVQIAVVTITLLPLYYGSYHYRYGHPYGAMFSGNDMTLQAAVSPEEAFINDWLDNRLISPFNPSPISWYCNQTIWHPSLILKLDSANGGIGNIRGNFLDFLLLAIEVGGSIVLPGMGGRSETDLSHVWASVIGFDAFFDTEWFLSTMQSACPQMKIFKNERDLQMREASPERFLPRSRRMDESFENTREAAIMALEQWFGEVGKPSGWEGQEGEEVLMVKVERKLFDADTRALPKGLRRNLGRVLRIRQDIKQLAAAIVQSMNHVNELDINPRTAIPKKAFYGAHLRTESDAQKAGFTDGLNLNFSGQTDAYIQQASKQKLSIIYAASGNATDLELFKQKAAAHSPPLHVTSKHDLLKSTLLHQLNSLTWDQQALVDFEVLKRCSRFGGTIKSSFSYNVALARNQWLEDQGQTMIDPFIVQHSEEGVSFDDGLSRIVGRDEGHERLIPRGMWP